MSTSKEIKSHIVQLIAESGCNVEILMQDFRHRCLSGLSMHPGYSNQNKVLIESTKNVSNKDVALIVDRTVGGLYGMGINPDRAWNDLAYYIESRLVEWNPLRAAGNLAKNAWNSVASAGQPQQPPLQRAKRVSPDNWMKNLANDQTPIAKPNFNNKPNLAKPQVSNNAQDNESHLSRLRNLNPAQYISDAINSGFDVNTGAVDPNAFGKQIDELNDYFKRTYEAFKQRNIGGQNIDQVFGQITKSISSLKTNATQIIQKQSEKTNRLQQELQNLQAQEQKMKDNMVKWINDATKGDVQNIQTSLKQLINTAHLQNVTYRAKPYMDPSNAYGLKNDPQQQPPAPPVNTGNPIAAPQTDFAHTQHQGKSINESNHNRPKPKRTMYDW